VVSGQRKAEFRWGLGIVAFLLTLISLAIFVDFPGSVFTTDAGWGIVVGILLVTLFFYLILPARGGHLVHPPSSRKRRRR
jgi:hypothetical protein